MTKKIMWKSTHPFLYEALKEDGAWNDRTLKAVSYNYDNAGNRSSMTVGAITTTYGYDAANKLLTAGTVSYTYDGNGNPLTKTDTSTSQTTTYTYDTENRLTTATLYNGQHFIYGYDYTGMKISNTQAGPKGEPDTHQYLWSKGSVVDQDGNEGQTANNVVHTVNLSQIFTPKTNYIPRVSYFHFDGLASVANVTDAGGNISDSYRYDAFGTTLSGGNTRDNHYQFIGKMGSENEASVGLTYMRNRWYDPNAGRFMTQDSVDIRGGLNLYGYVFNNPINGIDFLGLCPPTATSTGMQTSTATPTPTTNDGSGNNLSYPVAATSNAPGSTVPPGYNNLNVSFGNDYIGVTAGIIIQSDTGLIIPYLGAGAFGPGISLTGSMNSVPTPGDYWTAGLAAGGAASTGGQITFNQGTPVFQPPSSTEFGAGTLGLSGGVVTVYPSIQYQPTRFVIPPNAPYNQNTEWDGTDNR